MTSGRPKVFISYSHKDEDWKDRLVAHLRVLEQEGALDVWDDRRIAAGADWRPEIEETIQQATVAILIISKDFLTSRFIREEELTRILARRSRQELRVIPVIAEPCAWQAVEVLQGLQARPKDGRALSAGSEHQIDTDLSDLALEIRESVSMRPGEPLDTPTIRARGKWRILRACVPAVLLVLLAMASRYWRIDTRISLDLVTRRMSFETRGDRGQSLLDASAQFSELSIVSCEEATFMAGRFARAGGRGGAAGEGVVHAGPVRFRCDDRDAKITLTASSEDGGSVGSLDRLSLEPGARVMLDVRGTTPSVVTVDVSTGQQLSLPIPGDVRIVTDLVTVEPSAGPVSPVAEYEARLHEADRMLKVRTGSRGTVLLITPAKESVARFFDTEPSLAIVSLQFVDEGVGGRISTPLLSDGRLSYPGYPRLPSVTISGDDFLVLNRTTDMTLHALALDSARGALKLTVESLLLDGAIGNPGADGGGGGTHGRWFDPRLTLYATIRYGSPWRLVGIAAAWVMVTAWLWNGRWLHLRSE